MATATDTFNVSGIRCERCVMRLATALEGQPGLDGAHANLMGEVTLTWNDVDTVGRVGEPDTAEPDEARQIATEARDRVRFEEEALALSDQVYRVARHLVGSREEAEDLVQETYARAFRSWRSFQPGTNLRAWLLRILTNLNIDRGRRQQRRPDEQPLEEGDYYLY